MAKKSNFSFVDELQARLEKIATVTRSGEVRIKRTDLKKALEEVFQRGLVSAAGGDKAKFPIIGNLVRRDVPARKAGKGINPFTKEPMTIKSRPASKKPRWSFPKSVKEVFANKKHW